MQQSQEKMRELDEKVLGISSGHGSCMQAMFYQPVTKIIKESYQGVQVAGLAHADVGLVGCLVRLETVLWQSVLS